MIAKKAFIIFTIITFINSNIYAAYTFEECNKIEQDTLREELNKLSQETFSSESSNIDIEKIIDKEWISLNMDSAIDLEIDDAVEKVKNEKGFFEKIWSAWSPSKAKEFAEKVGNYAFGSKKFEDNLTKLSTNVGDKLAKEMENVSTKSASSIIMCLSEFIKNKYSESITNVFQEEVKKTTPDIKLDKVMTDQPSVTGMHKIGLSGLGILIAVQIGKKLSKKMGETVIKRITAKIAQKIFGRLASKTVTAAIPIVGQIIGAGMIAWDLINSSDGALPQIQKDLKDEEVKQKIKGEILSSIKDELPKITTETAREIANNIYTLWSDFKNKFKQVLALAENMPEFKKIIDNSSKDNFYKLSNLVDILIKKIGKDKLIDSIKNGSFETIKDLPEESFQILEVTKSIQTLIEWSDLAGNKIDKVVEFEIYKQKKPLDFDKKLLEKLIEINDKKAISNLTLLDKSEIEAMFIISTVNLKVIATTLSTEDMKCITWYLPKVDQNSAIVIVTYAKSNPVVIMRLCDESIKKVIISASNKAVAIDFLLSPNAFFNDCIKIIQKNIPVDVFLNKYTVLQSITYIIFLLLIMLLSYFTILKIYRRLSIRRLNVPQIKN